MRGMRRSGVAFIGTVVVLTVLLGGGEAWAQMHVDYFAVPTDPDPLLRGRLQNVEQNHLDNARVMGDFRTGRYGAVVGDLKYALDRFSNHPRALQLLATVGVLWRRPEIAIPYFERAIRLYPQYAVTHSQYGRYLVQIGRVDDGIARLKEATRLDPQLGEGYAGLAIAYMKRGEPESARLAAAKARELGYKGKLPGVGTDN